MKTSASLSLSHSRGCVTLPLSFPLIISPISLLPQANTGLIFASPAFFFFALTGIFSLCTIRQALLLKSMQIALILQFIAWSSFHFLVFSPLSM